MVNSKGYLLFYTRWWFLFLQKKGILCLCAQLPIAEQLPFIPICCMPFQPGKKNCEWLWQHSLKSTHILKQRNKQKIEPVNINLSLITCRKFTCLVRFIFSYSSEKKIRNDTGRKHSKMYFTVIYLFNYSKCIAYMICQKNTGKDVFLFYLTIISF